MIQSKAVTLPSLAKNEPLPGTISHTSAGALRAPNAGSSYCRSAALMSAGSQHPTLPFLFSVTCHVLWTQQPGFLVT